MSNKRRLKPPPWVSSVARAYRCPDCAGRVFATARHGSMWGLHIRHEYGCPAVRGTTSGLHEAAAAACVRFGGASVVVSVVIRDE